MEDMCEGEFEKVLLNLVLNPTTLATGDSVGGIMTWTQIQMRSGR